jgi:hypothetical protein
LRNIAARRAVAPRRPRTPATPDPAGAAPPARAGSAARLPGDGPERYADRLELAYVDDAAHFVTDDAPAAVADLSLDWSARAA